MRAGGCAINDYADRDFDPHVARTAERPLAAGRVSGREALAIFVVLSLMALALLLSLRSTLALWLSLPAVALAAAYRSEEHTSELQSLMRISYAVFCLKKKNTITYTRQY